MRKLSALLIALLLTGFAFGQGKHALSYQDQYVKLYKEYTKDPQNVVNLMAMAHFFSDQDNPQFNLPLAAGYIQQAETLFTNWVKSDEHYRQANKYIRKGVSIATIRELRKEIDNKAAAYVAEHIADIRAFEAASLLEAFAKNVKVVQPLMAKDVADRFEEATRENTIESYYAFIKAHPNSFQADSAEAALSLLAPRFFSNYTTEKALDSLIALYPQSNALQSAATKQKSRLAYAHACRVNTVESFSAYLEQFPRGADYLEALAKLHELRNVDYGTIDSPEGLADFAETHEDNPLADSALAKLRTMVFDQHRQEAALIYLERFPLDPYYSTIYKEYYKWHADEGNRQPIEAFAAANKQYPYQLALTSDLSLGSKIDGFDLTRPFREADLDTMTSVVRLLTGRKVAFVALQRILQQQIMHKDWANAKRRLQKFELSFEDVSTDQYEELSSLLTSATGPTLSHFFSADSITHAISHASGAVYFTRQHQGRQGIYIAHYTGGKKGSWKVTGKVTVQGADSNVTAYNFYDKGTKVLLGINGDIWSANVVNDTLWVISERFPYPVNSTSMERDAYMLADGSGMLLASDRPGGHNMQRSGSYYHGDYQPATDIYYVPNNSGRWGDAKNLGFGVNSQYCELSPILSRNMRTLYFITDARGLGYGDVYRTSRDNVDDWTHWSKPVNVGRGVNGAFNEASISFSPSEKHILLTSNSANGNQYATYTFSTQHDTSSAYRDVYVDFSSIKNVLRSADLAMVRNNTVTEHLTDRQVDSVHHYALYKGKEYAVLVESDWFYVPTLLIDGSSDDHLMLRGMGLDALKSQADAIPLPLSRFYEGTSKMLPLAEVELRHLGRFMQQRTASRVEIEVHVQGSDDRQCYDLSLERAKAIRAFLSDYGVDTQRIRVSAYGNVKYKNNEKPSPVGVRFF